MIGEAGMAGLDMIESEARRRCIISIIIDIRNVAIVVYTEFCGL